MNEAIRKTALFLWAFSFVNYAYAAEPVIIYGASETAPGVRDSSTVKLLPGEPNPLGEPIVTQGFQSADDDGVLPQAVVEPTKDLTKQQNSVSETLPQNPPISAQDSPQAVNKQIQNTLYESGNRIYDVQSYPVNDINTITQPNTQPTVNTYPSY